MWPTPGPKRSPRFHPVTHTTIQNTLKCTTRLLTSYTLGTLRAMWAATPMAGAWSTGLAGITPLGTVRIIIPTTRPGASTCTTTRILDGASVSPGAMARSRSVSVRAVMVGMATHITTGVPAAMPMCQFPFMVGGRCTGRLLAGIPVMGMAVTGQVSIHRIPDPVVRPPNLLEAGTICTSVPRTASALQTRRRRDSRQAEPVTNRIMCSLGAMATSTAERVTETGSNARVMDGRPNLLVPLALVRVLPEAGSSAITRAGAGAISDPVDIRVAGPSPEARRLGP
jgi:hypothetical protein